MARGVPDNDGGVSRRAVVVGAILLVALSVTGLYVEIVHGLTYNFASLVPPIAPLALTFLVVALNPLIFRRSGRGLSRREILTIGAMITVAGPLMAHGILLHMLAGSIGQYYFGRAAPEWEAAFFDQIPGWFAPAQWQVAEGFFVGRTATPWGAWSPALGIWGSFLTALFLTNLFLVLILKRQWIKHERLSFPIAMIPLEMVRETGDARRQIGRLPVSWAFWIGFAVSAALDIQNRLPSIFPAFPRLPTWETLLIPWQKVGPLAGIGDIWLVLYPSIIGLAFLIPKELSFSMWFFWLLRVGLTVAAIAAGATPRRPEEWYGTTFPAPYYQGGGALLALGVWGLWTAGRHLGRVGQSAIHGRSEGRYSQEPFSYRWLVTGFAVCFGYLVYLCWLAGSRLWVAMALIGLIVAYHMVWARLRAENGMSFIAFPFHVDAMLLQPFGSRIYRPAEIITIKALRWAFFPGWGESVENVTGGTMDAFKVADSAGIGQRRLTIALVVGFLVSLCVGMPLLLWACYRYGFLSMSIYAGWVYGQVRNAGAVNFEEIVAPSTFNPAALAWLCGGGVLTIFLGLMRHRFWWWPFHPVGYLAANVWGSQWWCMPLFIGWAAKSLVVRYGGLRLYQRLVPAAIGVIVAEQLTTVLWTAVGWLARSVM